MSSQLFNSVPIHISQVETVEVQLEDFLSSVGLEKQFWSFVGSFGKKEFSGDVDIAVQINDSESLNDWAETFEQLGLKFKISKGFNLISFGFPLQFGSLVESRIIQVDLFLTKDLSWTEYMLYSPDLSAGESNFGGVYRNLLLMATSINETKTFVDEYTWEQDQIELFTGWYRVKKTVKSESGNILKTPRVLEKNLLTTEPWFIFNSLGLEKVYTFEDLWKQVVNKPKIEEIKCKFEEYCKNLNLELPWERLNK